MSEVISLLNEARVPTKEHGDNVGAGFINICCPFCGEPRFHLGINLEEHWFKCLMCGQGGSWYTLAAALRDAYPHVNWFSLRSSSEQPKYLDKDTISPATKRTIQQLTRPFNNECDHAAWQYLTETRYLSPELIQDTKITVGKGRLRGYVTFVDGDFIAARKFRGYGPDWWKQGSANNPYGATWAQRVRPLWAAITEGVFDVLAVPLGHALGMFGITTSSKWLDIAMDFLPDTKIIILGLDRGVSSKTIGELTFIFLDCGYEVATWDWCDPLFDGIKDLDEVRLRFGRDWLHDRLLELVGQGASTSDSLVDLL